VRVLVLAPHPFFQERGTPIDVEILVRALGARADTRVDLLVYAEGEDRSYPGVTLHRAADLRLARGVRPGFSPRKLVADALLFAKALQLVRRNRYDVIHAGEEAAFMALFFRRFYGIPFVYDLDSSIAQQLVESRPGLAPLARLFDRLETLLVRRALATAPVCNALRDLCEARGARKVVTLHDISQLRDPDAPRTGRLRREVGSERLLLVYAGNLEPYQGIDLLLEAFALAARRSDAVDLVVIGGVPDDVAAYRAKAAALGIAERAHLIGPRPFDELDRYLADADILAAPRVKGVNTPMKVFPYLHSGRPVLVTDLPTHSQILTPDVARLAPPTVEAFADAIVELAGDAALRETLGRAGRAFVEREHTFDAHRRRVDELYDYVAAQLAA
jgi:glycosyltransferase involved in cell wall biosynthesis